MGTESVIRIVETSLNLLARVAPDVVRALLGGQTVEEAIAQARATAQDVPVLTGERGTWTRDLERRKAALDEES